MGFRQWFLTLLTGSKLKAGLLEGDRLLASENYVDALNVFREITHAWPNEPAGYEGMSRTYQAMGLRLEARREADIADALEALENDPDDVHSRTKLAQALYEKEMYGWAAAQIQHALKLAPRDPEVLETAVLAFTSNRNFAKAVEAIRKLLAKRPLDAGLYEKLAVNLQGAQDPSGATKAAALAAALKAALDDPDDPAAVDRAVRNFLSRGMREQALELTERSLKAAPQAAALHRLHGEVLILDGQYKEALAALSQAVRLEPTDAKSHRLLAKAYQRLGQIEQYEHHQTMADHITAAHKSDDPLEAGVAMLRVLLDSGSLQEAKVLADGLIKEHPNDWRSPFMMGMVLSGHGKHKEALAAFNRARRLNDYSPYLHLEIARTLSELDEAVEAIGEARKAVALDPRDVKIRLALAELLRNHGYMDQAIEEEELVESLAK